MRRLLSWAMLSMGLRATSERTGIRHVQYGDDFGREIIYAGNQYLSGFHGSNTYFQGEVSISIFVDNVIQEKVN